MPILQDGDNTHTRPDPARAGLADPSGKWRVSSGLETPNPLLHNHRRRDEEGEEIVTEPEAATLAVRRRGQAPERRGRALEAPLRRKQREDP